MSKEPAPAPAHTLSPEPLPSREALVTQLRESGFDQLVARLSAAIGEPYESQVRQFEKQLASDDLPDAVKDHLRAAIESVRAAQRQANQPLLDRLAHAIATIAREHHVPLAFEREQTHHAAPLSAPRGPSRRRRLDREHLREQVKILARQSGEAGFTTTAIARRLQISKPQAMVLCKQMFEHGELAHNGRPRQGSRYLPARH